jgi:ABC-type multidrug transport system ATPase subunit
MIHAGRLVALGTVRELKEVFAGSAVLEVVAPRPADALETLSGQPWVLETSLFGRRLHVVVRDAEDGRRRVRALLDELGNGPAGVERITSSLEDVFIHHVEVAETQRSAEGVS